MREDKSSWIDFPFGSSPNCLLCCQIACNPRINWKLEDTMILYSICVDCSRMQYPHSVQFIRLLKTENPILFVISLLHAYCRLILYTYRVEFHCQEAQIVFSHFFYFNLLPVSFFYSLLLDALILMTSYTHSLSFIMPINLSHSMYNSLNLIEIKRITQKKQSATWGGFKMMRTEREKKGETKKKKNMCIKRNVHAIYVWW